MIDADGFCVLIDLGYGKFSENTIVLYVTYYYDALIN